MNDAPARRFSPVFVAIPAIILAVWAIPRLLVAWLGAEGHWTPLLYQYAMGGLVFVTGLWVIRASKACDFDRPGDRQWFRVLVFGYLAYLTMHTVVTWLAWAVPFRGVAG